MMTPMGQPRATFRWGPLQSWQSELARLADMEDARAGGGCGGRVKWGRAMLC